MKPLRWRVLAGKWKLRRRMESILTEKEQLKPGSFNLTYLIGDQV